MRDQIIKNRGTKADPDFSRKINIQRSYLLSSQLWKPQAKDNGIVLGPVPFGLGGTSLAKAPQVAEEHGRGAELTHASCCSCQLTGIKV